jgi:hypothetical protein
MTVSMSLQYTKIIKGLSFSLELCFSKAPKSKKSKISAYINAFSGIQSSKIKAKAKARALNQAFTLIVYIILPL